jgi:hypothetical protein
MSQTDMFANCGPGSLQIVGKERAEHTHISGASNVNVAATALARNDAAGIGHEEVSMILLNIGVVVLALRQHEADLTRQMIFRVRATSLDERFHEDFRELKVERVLPSL